MSKGAAPPLTISEASARPQKWMNELMAATMSEQDRKISEIIAAEGSRLRNFIRKRVPEEADVEDVLQEVFYEAVQAYRLMEPVQRWGAWMFQVARNRIIDLFRKRKRLESLGSDPLAVSDDGDTLRLEDVLASAEAGPADTYARGILVAELEAALAELPEEQRHVFIAHEIDGESFQQMAARTGVSINTLLSRKHYAVRHLRRRLQAIYKEFVRSGGRK